mgnify:CR=1 FL=1
MATKKGRDGDANAAFMCSLGEASENWFIAQKARPSGPTRGALVHARVPIGDIPGASGDKPLEHDLNGTEVCLSSSCKSLTCPGRHRRTGAGFIPERRLYVPPL